jgi:Ca2+-binding RTX toxin-like protein
MARRPSPGNDFIRGTNGADEIDALAGNDSVFGLGGDDDLSGGIGNDSIRGGDGADDIFAGNDLSDNFNRLFGDNGSDRITGSLGRDSVFGGADDDFLFGKENVDFLDGGDGNDVLFGGTGNDVVVGGNGSDLIQGTDQVGNGRGEKDILDGSESGGGRDTFILGNSSTVFYDDGIASSRGTNDFAEIEDFTDGKDSIQLNGRVNYRLENTRIGFANGVGIFVDNSGSTADELIGIVEDVNISQLSISGAGSLKFIR